mmetsp:Transcript_1967/g.5198  ORF Transcript_1967/g.5198 Transcript_1967/m.5198 type:complete len:228 (-) Transcript_1967:156-839(-)
MVSSYEAEKSTSSPSPHCPRLGANATDLTSPVWPCSTAMHSNSPSPLPPSAPPTVPERNDSQIHTDLSRPHVANSDPVPFHATHFTSDSCPSSWAVHSHPPSPDPMPLSSNRSHMATVPSKDADARTFPVGAKDTDRTVRACPPRRTDARTHGDTPSPSPAVPSSSLQRRLHIRTHGSGAPWHDARDLPSGDHETCQAGDDSIEADLGSSEERGERWATAVAGVPGF